MKRLLLLVLGWTLLLTPRMVAANEETDAAEAAARFQRAVDMYREGGYEGALAEFRKAYQISPSYRVLYNIAQAQYALHDFVGAYKSLMQYMSEGGADIPTERRLQVDEMFAKLGERIARIKVTVNLAGADVRIDDVSVGTSPLPEAVAVNVGTRKVSAFKAGSPEVVRVVTVAGKENLKIELGLIEQPSASAHAASTTKPLPVMVTTQARSEPSRIPLILSVSVAATCAVATGVFGYLALDAQKKLKDQVNTFPNDRSNIEDARTRSKRYAYLTDGFGAATLVSGGVALYLALTHHDGTKKKSADSSKLIVLTPTMNGVVMQSSF